MNFNEIYREKKEYIENVLKKYLPEQEGYQKVIMEAMEYSLMAGGKRLRPVLMLETYRLFGGEDRAIEPFLAAIEMIHTYSLVHDDLPAMDNDEYRRGRKTTHIVYGEDMGIMAGDALLNYAFETACSAFGAEGADCARIGKALRIAEKIGLAFQIQDDILDVTGTEEVLGKPVHSDEKNEKTTYVTWKGIEEARRDVERLTDEALDELGQFPARDEFLAQLLRSLVSREK